MIFCQPSKLKSQLKTAVPTKGSSRVTGTIECSRLIDRCIPEFVDPPLWPIFQLVFSKVSVGDKYNKILFTVEPN